MKKIFNYQLFDIGEFQLKVSQLIEISLIVLVAIGILLAIRKGIYKTHHIEEGKKYSIYNLLKYFILIVITIIILRSLGFDLSVVLAGSAALLVGIGLGLQSLFSDFISGIILLIDGSIKVGDILEINGSVCKVEEIKLRTTTVLTGDDKHIILPNSVLTKTQLINWSYSNIDSRFEIKIGVSYSSDIHLVMKLLVEAMEMQDGVISEPKPFTRFKEYGESSLEFSAYFWTGKIFHVESMKSEIRIRIFELFKKNNIDIPFPQRVVHLKKD
ncbi:hypothetical protein BH09BAC5_BH09BAC5_10530 [soil metagenome]